MGKYPITPFKYINTIEKDGMLELLFSHPLSKTWYENSNILINHKPAKKRLWSRDDKPNSVIIESSGLDSSGLQVDISGFNDIFQRTMKPATDSILWKNPEIIDTLGARIKFLNPTSQEAKIDGLIKFFFTEPVKKIYNIQERVQFFDMDSNLLSFCTKYIDLARYEIIPDRKLKYNQKYTVSILSDSIYDFYGNNCIDSVKFFSFNTIDKDLFGTISGEVETNEKAENLVIVCRHKDKKEYSYMTEVEPDGKYKIENLYPGSYHIHMYLDIDGNKKYNWGSIMPYRPAEKYKFYSKEINVRSRWETEKVNFRF